MAELLVSVNPDVSLREEKWLISVVILVSHLKDRNGRLNVCVISRVERWQVDRNGRLNYRNGRLNVCVISRVERWQVDDM